ncbi:MAG: hypothetical protein ABSC89_12225 [Verrucomicrobiota bacterium]|jgi:hypothetical protein
MTSNDRPDLDQIYEGARELFLLGKHERALERFLSVYEVDIAFRDVAAIVDDYYNAPKDKWIAKYEAQFQGQTPAMNEVSACLPRPISINERLLTLLASGARFERIVAELPQFKMVIESAFDRMKAEGRCTAAEVGQRADQLRELIQRKDDAVRRSDFDLAAKIRAEECALFKSFGLEAPTGKTWSTILGVGIDEQIRDLSALLDNTNTA